jgi:hypothetical protein
MKTTTTHVPINVWTRSYQAVIETRKHENVERKELKQHSESVHQVK